MPETAEKLSFQDASFLRLESAEHPFHVAGLMILRAPESTPRGYYRKLARHCGRLNEIWPAFNKKLKDPQVLRNPQWVIEENYNPGYHVFHYALPAAGRMEDLLALTSRVHERLLDRQRPLWEIHLIEGLPGNRFALYCKVHHALVDGVGALRMLNALFSTSPDKLISFRAAKEHATKHQSSRSLLQRIDDFRKELGRHYEAMPQVSGLLSSMGLDALKGSQEAPPLPFTAPRTLLNTEVDSRREIITCALPLGPMRRLAREQGGTVNDVLLCVCGGALRAYLQSHQALPKHSLEAGVPVSIRAKDDAEGNRVGFVITKLFTDEARPLRRLKRIITTMNQSKSELRKMSHTAIQDLANMLMMPTMLLTLAGRANQFPPATNAIVSNVPGSPRQLYLEGAALEAIYPFSVITDAMGVNITVISYQNKLCVAITSCPTQLPGIEKLGRLLRNAWRELSQAAETSKP